MNVFLECSAVFTSHFEGFTAITELLTAGKRKEVVVEDVI